MREPDPNFTPQEAAEARAYLREHGGEVQKKVSEDDDQLFVITDKLNEQEAAEKSAEEGRTIPPGEEVIYVTANDELIVDYWRFLLSQPPDVGQDMPDMHVRESMVADLLKQ